MPFSVVGMIQRPVLVGLIERFADSFCKVLVQTFDMRKLIRLQNKNPPLLEGFINSAVIIFPRVSLSSWVPSLTPHFDSHIFASDSCFSRITTIQFVFCTFLLTQTDPAGFIHNFAKSLTAQPNRWLWYKIWLRLKRKWMMVVHLFNFHLLSSCSWKQICWIQIIDILSAKPN